MRKNKVKEKELSIRSKRKGFVISKKNNCRMSIVKLLRVLDVPSSAFEVVNHDWARNEVRRLTNKQYGKVSFWERNESKLQDIWDITKHTFHVRLKETKHDFIENHEESTKLINAYTKAKELFKARGINV